jgi:glycosyltransferase involved in cell wall biosynthesis
MRFHLLSVPNAQTTRAYSLDGFSQAVMRFAALLKSMGHTVFLYASEENEAPCDELVTVISKEEIATLLGDCPYQYAGLAEKAALWELSGRRMVREIGRRKAPRDVIAVISGVAQQPVCAAHPELLDLEFSIGYAGCFARYRVFQSYAWMHHIYGKQNVDDGGFYDTVIPMWVDEDRFKYRAKGEDFLLYVGRIIRRKGLEVVCECARRAGRRLLLVGHGDKSYVSYGEFLGALPDDERNDLMSRASALVCPTTYIEPYGCVAVEAQMCGTPVIATDFGGFTETIEDGKSGFRCHLLGDFVRAARAVDELPREYIRQRALWKYSTAAAQMAYGAYFRRLETIWDEGWYTVGATAVGKAA